MKKRQLNENVCCQGIVRYKIINQKGILNVGGKTQSVYKFAKKSNKKTIRAILRKNNRIPLKQSMNLKKLYKLI